jgi:hypothetical protein
LNEKRAPASFWPAETLTLSGRRDSNPRPLVTNRSRPMLVIGYQKWALTCQDALNQ